MATKIGAKQQMTNFSIDRMLSDNEKQLSKIETTNQQPVLDINQNNNSDPSPVYDQELYKALRLTHPQKDECITGIIKGINPSLVRPVPCVPIKFSNTDGVEINHPDLQDPLPPTLPSLSSTINSMPLILPLQQQQISAEYINQMHMATFAYQQHQQHQLLQAQHYNRAKYMQIPATHPMNSFMNRYGRMFQQGMF